MPSALGSFRSKREFGKRNDAYLEVVYECKKLKEKELCLGWKRVKDKQDV